MRESSLFTAEGFSVTAPEGQSSWQQKHSMHLL